jgi:hypothetical protein
MLKICKSCGLEFKTPRKKTLFCDQTCYGKFKEGKGGKPHTEESKFKISLANTGKTRSEEFKKNRSIKYSGKGNPFWAKTHSKEIRNKLSEKQKERQSIFGCPFDDIPKFGSKNPFYGKHHSNQTRKILSDKIIERINNGQLNMFKIGRTGAYKGFFYHSMYELARMIQLENNPDVSSFKKNTDLKIEYEYKGKKRIYLPDFIIEMKDGRTIVEEIKGFQREKDSAKAEYAKRELLSKGIEYRILYRDDIFGSAYQYRKFLKEKSL